MGEDDNNHAFTENQDEGLGGGAIEWVDGRMEVDAHDFWLWLWLLAFGVIRKSGQSRRWQILAREVAEVGPALSPP